MLVRCRAQRFRRVSNNIGNDERSTHRQQLCEHFLLWCSISAFAAASDSSNNPNKRVNTIKKTASGNSSGPVSRDFPRKQLVHTLPFLSLYLFLQIYTNTCSYTHEAHIASETKKTRAGAAATPRFVLAKERGRVLFCEPALILALIFHVLFKAALVFFIYLLVISLSLFLFSFAVLCELRVCSCTVDPCATFDLPVPLLFSITLLFFFIVPAMTKGKRESKLHLSVDCRRPPLPSSVCSALTKLIHPQHILVEMRELKKRTKF